MRNDILGWGLLLILAIAFLMGAFGVEDDGAYIVMGIGMLFFGIWGGIRLIKI
jgi:hypothetical protein